ncbi:MAG: hypothetical protein Q9P01_07370 [Anaerolineae bacterium]|nr:hypothetical protein [Anaerolineae bacterium]MDQ7034645.1 hypothetical protein [Anaerolineae bacterium]
MRQLGLFLLLLLSTVVIQAQDEDLTTTNLQLETRLDAFGIEEEILQGVIVNNGTTAYSNVTVIADLLAANGDVIGEAFGFVVDACGTALVDEALQPNSSAHFRAVVDLFEEDEVVDYEFFIAGTMTDPIPLPDYNFDGVTQISDDEVVALEWESETTFRYGVGCDAQVFNTYEWHRYNLATGESQALEASPDEQYITEAFIRQTGINQLSQTRTDEPTLFQLSFLTFSPFSTRIVYQNDLRTLITAEEDGSFKRVVHQNLHQYSLQGFNWSLLDNFVAYYFGAYGEPVRYFTASASRGLISTFFLNNTPSVTVPGVVNDGRRVIISGTFPDTNGEDVTGYWLSSVITQQRELLFAVDNLPGNNYPAPAYYRKNESTRYIYVVRPIDGQATLQCYFREGGELHTLTELPLQLDNDERAWMWLSPDFTMLAIGANGTRGGLWLVDLTTFDVCQ